MEGMGVARGCTVTCDPWTCKQIKKSNDNESANKRMDRPRTDKSQWSIDPGKRRGGACGRLDTAAGGHGKAGARARRRATRSPIADRHCPIDGRAHSPRPRSGRKNRDPRLSPTGGLSASRARRWMDCLGLLDACAGAAVRVAFRVGQH